MALKGLTRSPVLETSSRPYLLEYGDPCVPSRRSSMDSSSPSFANKKIIMNRLRFHRTTLPCAEKS